MMKDFKHMYFLTWVFVAWDYHYSKIVSPPVAMGAPKFVGAWYKTKYNKFMNYIKNKCLKKQSLSSVICYKP